MKLSITAADIAADSAPILLRGDFYQNIDEAVKIGYRFMEIHLRVANQIDGAGLKAYCDERSFAISTIGTGMGYVVDKLSLTDADGGIRRQAVERLKEHIDLAEILQCGVIIGSMKGIIQKFEHYNRYERYCLECMRQLADYAGPKKVPLYLEAINRYETNFLNTVEDALDFIVKIGSPLVKALIDTFHMNIEEADIEKSISRCKGGIGHVHFADSNRRYPGAGHIDFEVILNALLSIQYQGYGALECLPYPHPIQAARCGLMYLKSLNKNPEIRRG